MRWHLYNFYVPCVQNVAYWLSWAKIFVGDVLNSKHSQGEIFFILLWLGSTNNRY